MARADILVINPNSNPAVTRGPRCGARDPAPRRRPVDPLRDARRGAVRHRERRRTSSRSRCRCAGWSSRTTRPTPSSSPASAIPACMCAARRRGGRCSASTNAACSPRSRAATASASSRSRRSRSRATAAICGRWDSTDRLAGERPLEMSVAETASGEGTFARMETVGRALVEQDGADVDRHGLRRHGAPPPPARSGARRAGDRPDASGGRDGDRHGAGADAVDVGPFATRRLHSQTSS